MGISSAPFARTPSELQNKCFFNGNRDFWQLIESFLSRWMALKIGALLLASRSQNMPQRTGTNATGGGGLLRFHRMAPAKHGNFSALRYMCESLSTANVRVPPATIECDGVHVCICLAQETRSASLSISNSLSGLRQGDGSVDAGRLQMEQVRIDGKKSFVQFFTFSERAACGNKGIAENKLAVARLGHCCTAHAFAEKKIANSS